MEHVRQTKQDEIQADVAAAVAHPSFDVRRDLQAIGPEQVAAFEEALEQAGVAHGS